LYSRIRRIKDFEEKKQGFFQKKFTVFIAGSGKYWILRKKQGFFLEEMFRFV